MGGKVGIMAYLLVIFSSIFISGCIHFKPSLTASKDLSNSSKPSYGAKIEFYKDINLNDFFKERKTSEVD